MKSLIIISVLLTAYGCKGQRTSAKDDVFNVSHGVALEKIDSAQLKDVRFVHFDSSVGVIFPKDYAEKKFGKIMGWEKYVFFMPDTTLIKNIDAKIINQYCIALARFDSAKWSNTIENLKGDINKRNLARAKKQMADQKESFAKNCPQWQQGLVYQDKQYIGYVTDSGDKIVYVQFLDFREDPYKLKSVFSVSWIDGWHGWFETNTIKVRYHIDKELLTLNEDL